MCQGIGMISSLLKLKYNNFQWAYKYLSVFALLLGLKYVERDYPTFLLAVACQSKSSYLISKCFEAIDKHIYRYIYIARNT
jgi:hypothetical protein